MKRLFTILTLAIGFALPASLTNQAAAQPRVGVNITYQDFYDELSPYGQWMDYPDYGYVWVPSAGPDFQPYQTNGHWVYSDDYEWMWVSDYNWGWAPFHYGRWFNDPGYGWMWMPGYEWAPAWVAWRDGGDYYGWAPLRPGINIGINFSIGSYNPPADYWCFAPRRYISSPRIWDYCAPRGQNVTIINNTTIINNYSRRTNNVFVTGPRRHDAERYAGRINPVRFRESNSPGRSQIRRNEVSFYRPSVARNDNNRNFAPKKFERYDRNGSRDGVNLPGRRVGGNDRTTGRINPQTDANNRNDVRQRNGVSRDRTIADANNGRDRRDVTDRRQNDRQTRQFDRQQRNDGNQQRNDVDRQQQQRQIQTQQDRQPRQFDRQERNDADRQQQRQMQQRNDADRQQQQRQMQQRNDADRQQQQRQMQQRNDADRQQQQRQMQQQQRQVQQQQERQPRQFDRQPQQDRQPRQFDRQPQQRQSAPQMDRQQSQPRFERSGGGDNRGGGNGGGRGGRRDR